MPDTCERFIEHLESMADRIGDAHSEDLQALLRRAALRLRNPPGLVLDRDVDEIVTALAREIGMSRQEVANRIIREWFDTNSYVPLQAGSGRKRVQ